MDRVEWLSSASAETGRLASASTVSGSGAPATDLIAEVRLGLNALDDRLVLALDQLERLAVEPSLAGALRALATEARRSLGPAGQAVERLQHLLRPEGHGRAAAWDEA